MKKRRCYDWVQLSRCKLSAQGSVCECSKLSVKITVYSGAIIKMD